MGSPAVPILVSLVLVALTAFFVLAEYSLVSSRRSRVESAAKKGSATAKLVLAALDDLSRYIAGTQIGITLLGIGIGSYTEPLVTHALEGLFPTEVRAVSFAVSLLLVTFVLVVIGELVPKYLVLKNPEAWAMITFRPLRFIVVMLKPLVWLAQNASRLVLAPFGGATATEKEVMQKDELVMLVQAGRAEGVLEEGHAEMVSRALRLDNLQARDIMVHRLDVKWVDADLTRDGVLRKLKSIPYSRIPVCRGDIDEMAGILYVHDVMKNLDNPGFKLEALIRPVVAIPENLTFERIVTTMREGKTQMLIVMDEYGGTSGIITLEDVVEEVFGELEDRIESERPMVEMMGGGRVSARADVRYDELLSRLKLDPDPDGRTDTLAQMVVDELERVPRPGDSVEIDLGTLRVENMARRRVTRVSLQLKSVVPPERTV